MTNQKGPRSTPSDEVFSIYIVAMETESVAMETPLAAVTVSVTA